MRGMFSIVLLGFFNLTHNQEDPIINRLLLPFAMVLGVIRDFVTIWLPRAILLPIRQEVRSAISLVKAIGFWLVIGFVWAYYRLVPESAT